MVGCRCSCIFALVLICVYMSGTSAYYYSSSSSSYEFRRKAEKKLEILTNEVSRLADALSTQDDHMESNPVTLVSVDRTTESNETSFTVVYTKHVEPLFYTVTFMDKEYRETALETQEEQVSDDAFSIMFSCNESCASAENIVMVFTVADESSGIEIHLNNTGTLPRHQGTFRVPVLEPKRADDLVYYPSRDVKFTVTSSSGEPAPGQTFEDLKASLRVIDLPNGSLTTRSSSTMIRRQVAKRFLKTTDTIVTVYTSQEEISGFVKLSLILTDTDAPLVPKIKVLKSLVLRPSAQTGPFPEDFVSFTNEVRVGDHGRAVMYSCGIGNSCSLRCDAAGSSISDMELKELQGNGEWEPVTSASVSARQYSSSIEWTLSATENMTDRVYQCEARSAVSGNVTSQRVEAQLYTQSMYADPARSGYQVNRNETEGDTMTFWCTVIGRPVVTIYFVVYFRDSYGEQTFYVDAQQLNRTTLGEVVGTAELNAETSLMTQTLPEVASVACRGPTIMRRAGVDYDLELSE